jgi:hypothetical protein
MSQSMVSYEVLHQFNQADHLQNPTSRRAPMLNLTATTSIHYRTSSCPSSSSVPTNFLSAYNLLYTHFAIRLYKEAAMPLMEGRHRLFLRDLFFLLFHRNSHLAISEGFFENFSIFMTSIAKRRSFLTIFMICEDIV